MPVLTPPKAMAWMKEKNTLKITLTITDAANADKEQLRQSKRLKYSDEIRGHNRFKLSGVKHIFIVAIVPETPETYTNCETSFLAINLSSLKTSMSADMKLANISA